MTKTDLMPRRIDVTGRSTGSPRVLIVRLSAVGDCVQTMPLASAVRRHWPAAHLTWVVEKGAAPLVSAHEAVDRVIVLPKQFARSVRMLAAIRRELCRERFDFSLDPQGLTKSGLIARLSGAPRRIGFARPVGREINPWLQTECVASHALHRVERYMELLHPLGINDRQVRFGLTIPSAAEALATAFSQSAALRAGYIVLNPGAGWDSKRWPHERYAEVARHLARRGLPSVVTWGGDDERRWAEQIVAQGGGAAMLAPATSLLELAAVVRQARAFVGSDTGPLHLAAALGTPCVALFGASLAKACGPYGSGHVLLQAALDESPSRKRQGADNWAIRMIGTSAVCRACDHVLDGARRSPSHRSHAA